MAQAAPVARWVKITVLAMAAALVLFAVFQKQLRAALIARDFRAAAIAQNDDAIRETASRLCDYGPAGLAAAARLADDPDPHVRMAVIPVLATFSETPDARNALRHLYTDDNDRIAIAALQIAPTMTCSKTWAALQALVTTAPPAVRMWACEAMSYFHTPAPNAALLAIIADKQQPPEVIAAAVAAYTVLEHRDHADAVTVLKTTLETRGNETFTTPLPWEQKLGVAVTSGTKQPTAAQAAAALTSQVLASRTLRSQIEPLLASLTATQPATTQPVTTQFTAPPR